jgi:hypothetical protein
MSGQWLRSCLFAGILCFPASGALASPDGGSPAQTAALLRAGADSARTGDWQACIELLTAAAALEDRATTWGDLGLCEEQAGRFALAHGHLARALESAPTDARDDPWQGYQAALGRVRPRVALLIVTADPSNARVVIDGRPMGQADGRTLALEPGTHTISARLAGYDDETVERSMRAGDMPNVHLWLKRKPAPDPPLFRPLTPTWTLLRPAWTARGLLVTAAYTGAATALVSGATALGFEVHYRSLRSALDEKGYRPESCRTLQAPATMAECTDVAARIQQRDTAATVWIGSSIAFAALSGIAGLAISLDRSPVSPRVTVTASGEGGGLFVLGNW